VRRLLLVLSVTMLVMSKTAVADFTLGLGLGPLYSGLGLNFGKTTESSFTYGSLGCVGYSSTGVAMTSDGSQSATVNSEKIESSSNCGFGFGYVSSALFKNNRHGVGLSIGLTSNTDDQQNELRIAPGYHYFFNGINNRGATLGLGAMHYADDSQPNNLSNNANSVFINIGYQF